MRANLLLRSLVASMVALTFSHAAVLDKKDCVAEPHDGTIELWWGSMDYYGDPSTTHVFVGLLAKTIYETGFFLAAEESQIADFHFNGCQGGSAVEIYCVNCDRPFSDAHLVTKSVAVDTNKQRTNWWLFNGGANPDWLHEPSTDGAVYSQYFMWGADNTIYPVTYQDPTHKSNQTNEIYARYDRTSTTQIIFLPSIPANGRYWYLVWQEYSPPKTGR